MHTPPDIQQHVHSNIYTSTDLQQHIYNNTDTPTYVQQHRQSQIYNSISTKPDIQQHVYIIMFTTRDTQQHIYNTIIQRPIETSTHTTTQIQHQLCNNTYQTFHKRHHT